MVNLERICKDFARITSDNVDPGGICKDFASSDVDPVGGDQLGKDLQRLCKDYL